MVIVASSLNQARIAGEHARAFLGIEAGATWRILYTQQFFAITHRETGTRLRCIGSDPKRAHGLAPALVLADEPAQWPHTTAAAMVSALTTSMGKIPGSRMVAIGTRPDSTDHWFAKMCDGGAAYAQVHAAAPTDPAFQLRTWKRANPSLGIMPDLVTRIRREAVEARRDPDKLQAFRALRLNLGTSDVAVAELVGADTWRRVESPEPLGEREYVLGLDLGTNAAMSAAAAYWPHGGRCDALACFPRQPAVAERGLADGVGNLYSKMVERGELMLAGERVSDIAALLTECVHRWGMPAVVVCDRWREAEMREKLGAAGLSMPVKTRGQGFKDGGEDVRMFRAAVLKGDVHPARSLLLRHAVGGARVQIDPAGNAKLAKNAHGGRRHRMRDDDAAAAILAVAEGARRAARPAPSFPDWFAA